MTTKLNKNEISKDLNGGKLVTEEDFMNFEQYIYQEMERVRNNPELAKKQLQKTGMHDKNGKLKPEFSV